MKGPKEAQDDSHCLGDGNPVCNMQTGLQLGRKSEREKSISQLQ